MMRLFDQHKRRRTQLLSGMWQFVTDPDDTGLAKSWASGLPENALTVAVPSCWNNEFGLYQYEGTAWYGREVFTYAPDFRLVFEAVMTECTVFFDGREIVRHYGGFTAFDAVLRNVEPGAHTLVLRVSNAFDEDSIPQTNVDWYHYGGITRDILLEELRGICVMNQYMTYTLNDGLTDAIPVFHLTVRNFGAARSADTLRISLNGTLSASAEFALDPDDSAELTLAGAEMPVRLWSPAEPNLYTLTYETAEDDLIDRTGFRKIEVRDRKILLNGKPAEFRGVCRHEDDAAFGMAFPRRLMLRDVDILKNMNANAVRGSHYPNAQTFVDYLDANGIFFWSEIPIWGCGFSEEALAREKVLERGLAMHREMITQYRNHPCIVLWGLHNEIMSYTENGRKMTQLFADEVRSLDDSRPITYASSHPMEDICFDIADIVSVNRYIGWYDSETDAWDGFLPELKKRLEETGNGGKPILMSEFGAAAIYGYSTFDNVRWTEEYQEDLIRHTLTLFRSDDAVCGTFIWQFADGRTSQQMGLNRARGFNNKGILNEQRKPKRAYYAAKEIYAQPREGYGL